MENRLTNIIAICLLTFVFLLAVFSMKNDSATMDELAHLPAGYSYLTQKDMRLNPEHPPLIKDLAAVPLLFIQGINFPSDIQAWQEDINGQWTFGEHFLYQSQNPTDKMIFWARVPMVLVLVLFGFYIFKWTRELYGDKAALISLFLFSFSPTFISHGRLVTTDVAAAFGIFIATFYFLRALKETNKKNIVLAAISFAIAQLFKFTALLLVPFFVFLAFVWYLVNLKDLQKAIKVVLLTFVIGFLVILPVYQYHILNYPPERQARDIQFLLSSHPIQSLGPLLAQMAKIPILRAYAQYFLGAFLVFQRGIGGHTTYFLGEVSASGWKNYFPIVYLIKEPLAFHILTLIAILYAAWVIKKPFWQDTLRRTENWIKNHFPEFAMLCFIGIYWAISLISNLNIGVRHLLPVFPFTFLLVSKATISWLKKPHLKVKYLVLGVLLLWQASSVLTIYPHFLAYFNEIVGGPDNGYVYTVNSNLDWGQDLKRLKKWIGENKIDKIYVDYFGGGKPEYYLKEKFSPWWGEKPEADFPKGNYLAVSATFLQGGRGKPVSGFDQSHSYYDWLNKYTPVAKIGYSIFVYYIN